MVCDKCDPMKLYRYENVENTIIQIPATGLSKNEQVDWIIKKCKYCNQKFNIPTYDVGG
jgi:hypothetical protein